jgi:ribosomal protein S12 methylthiotransferase
VPVDIVRRDGAVGRSSADAPEIDGQVHVQAAKKNAMKNIKPGDVIRARVTDTNEHDLIATFIE